MREHLKRRPTAMLVTLAVFSIISFLWLLPFREDVYLLREKALHSLAIVLGVCGPFFALITILFDSPFVVIPLLLLIGVLVGVIAQMWWWGNFGDKLTISVVIGLNILSLWLIDRVEYYERPSGLPTPEWAWSSISPYQRDSVCENIFTSQYGIRARRYVKFDDDAYVFVSFTKDAGKSWQEVVNFYIRDERQFPNYLGSACQNLQIVDDDFWVFWITRMLVITRDAGQTWQAADFCDYWRETATIERCRVQYGEIMNVQFDNNLTGTLDFEFLTGEEHKRDWVFTTSDGGLTWHITE